MSQPMLRLGRTNDAVEGTLCGDEGLQITKSLLAARGILDIETLEVVVGRREEASDQRVHTRLHHAFGKVIHVVVRWCIT